MKAEQTSRRRQQRRADQIRDTAARIAELEHGAKVARAELDRRVALALAGEASHLARPPFVRSSLAGVLDIARQLTVTRARLARLQKEAP